MNLDARILRTLRASVDGISDRELAEKLDIGRATVRSRIESLRGMGYEIEASPHQGYRVLSAPDSLNADELVSRLGKDVVIGREIQVFQETTSTNDVVEKLARDGVKEGIVVFAESQSRGRGRLGRKWISSAGKGLWFSVLLRPPWPPRSVSRMTIAAAVALVRGIQGQTGLRPVIKWPNDILIGTRKVSGILTELSAEPDRVKHVVVGIGVDVHLDASSFPAELRNAVTSLNAELGRDVDRSALAASILLELDRTYAQVRHGRFETVAEEWERLCETIGADVGIRFGDRLLQGRAESLDADGALLLRTSHGHLERVVGGDVTVER